MLTVTIKEEPKLPEYFPQNLHLGDSELASKIREYDWSKTELGPISNWPQNLCIALSICLTSQFPMFIWWGKNLIYLYNDAYIPFLGANKHPVALGQSGRIMWPEMLPAIEPMIEQVFSNKTACLAEDILMFFERELPYEEVYVTFSYSPIFDGDEVVGLFCACTETTEKLVHNRRLETLSALARDRTEVETIDEVCRKSALILAANFYDITFSVIYKINMERTQLQLTALSGLDDMEHPFPSSIDVTCEEKSIWSLQTVLLNQTKEMVDLEASNIKLPGGPWSEFAEKAIVLPIPSTISGVSIGCLIVGVNPRRVLDDHYLSFYDLVTRHIGIAITDAELAAENERLQAAKEEAEKENQAKDLFLATLSHELRTPLTSMLCWIDVLKSRNEPSVVKKGIQSIKESVLTQHYLVNDLLDISSIILGKMSVELEEIDLIVVIRSSINTVLPEARKKNIKVIFYASDKSILLNLDKIRMHQIFCNLLRNAIKFSPAGEKIEITLIVLEEDIQVRIKDNGIGISPEFLPHIFKHFSQADSSYARSYGGLGLGLALVYNFLKLQGGSIYAESAGLNLGSQFTLCFPKKSSKYHE